MSPLNEPMTKDVSALLAQATNPDCRSCSTLTDCLDREALAKLFKAIGKMVPNLTWKIQDVWVTEDRIVVLGEASGTPAKTFVGVEPTGRNFTTTSLDVFTVKDGKLSSAYHVENWVGAIAQVEGRVEVRPKRRSDLSTRAMCGQAGLASNPIRRMDRASHGSSRPASN
jgi:predicted ester cyclase